MRLAGDIDDRGLARPRSVAIGENGMSTIQQAVDHVSNGGAIGDVPDEFLLHALLHSSVPLGDNGELPGDAVGAARFGLVAPHTSQAPLVFLEIDKSGQLTSRGFIVKSGNWQDSLAELTGQMMAQEWGFIASPGRMDGPVHRRTDSTPALTEMTPDVLTDKIYSMYPVDGTDKDTDPGLRWTVMELTPNIGVDQNVLSVLDIEAEDQMVNEPGSLIQHMMFSLMGNVQDRHGGNWLISDRRPVPIDYGFGSFAGRLDGEKLRADDPRFGEPNTPLAYIKSFMDNIGDDLDGVLETLTPDQREEVARREVDAALARTERLLENWDDWAAQITASIPDDAETPFFDPKTRLAHFKSVIEFNYNAVKADRDSLIRAIISKSDRTPDPDGRVGRPVPSGSRRSAKSLKILNRTDPYQDVEPIESLLKSDMLPEEAIAEHERQMQEAAAKRREASQTIKEEIEALLDYERRAKSDPRHRPLAIDGRDYKPEDGRTWQDGVPQDGPGERPVYLHQVLLSPKGSDARVGSAIAIKRDGQVFWMEVAPDEAFTPEAETALRSFASDVQQSMAALPDFHAQLVRSVGLSAQPCPRDAALSEERGKKMVTSAWSLPEEGQITFFNGSYNEHTMWHEVGHLAWDHFKPGAKAMLQEAARADGLHHRKIKTTVDIKTSDFAFGGTHQLHFADAKDLAGSSWIGITEYATTEEEDFAESYRLAIADAKWGFIGVTSAPGIDEVVRTARSAAIAEGLDPWAAESQVREDLMDGIPVRMVDLYPSRVESLVASGIIVSNEPRFKTLRDGDTASTPYRDALMKKVSRFLDELPEELFKPTSRDGFEQAEWIREHLTRVSIERTGGSRLGASLEDRERAIRDYLQTVGPATFLSHFQTEMRMGSSAFVPDSLLAEMKHPEKKESLFSILIDEFDDYGPVPSIYKAATARQMLQYEALRLTKTAQERKDLVNALQAAKAAERDIPLSILSDAELTQLERALSEDARNYIKRAMLQREEVMVEDQRHQTAEALDYTLRKYEADLIQQQAIRAGLLTPEQVASLRSRGQYGRLDSRIYDHEITERDLEVADWSRKILGKPRPVVYGDIDVSPDNPAGGAILRPLGPDANITAADLLHAVDAQEANFNQASRMEGGIITRIEDRSSLRSTLPASELLRIAKKESDSRDLSTAIIQEALSERLDGLEVEDLYDWQEIRMHDDGPVIGYLATPSEQLRLALAAIEPGDTEGDTSVTEHEARVRNQATRIYGQPVTVAIHRRPLELETPPETPDDLSSTVTPDNWLLTVTYASHWTTSDPERPLGEWRDSRGLRPGSEFAEWDSYRPLALFPEEWQWADVPDERRFEGDQAVAHLVHNAYGLTARPLDRSPQAKDDIVQHLTAAILKDQDIYERLRRVTGRDVSDIAEQLRLRNIVGTHTSSKVLNLPSFEQATSYTFESLNNPKDLFYARSLRTGRLSAAAPTIPDIATRDSLIGVDRTQLVAIRRDSEFPAPYGVLEDRGIVAYWDPDDGTLWYKTSTQTKRDDRFVMASRAPLRSEQEVRDYMEEHRPPGGSHDNDVYDLVNSLIAAWADTSGDEDSVSLTMQRAFQDEFGIDADPLARSVAYARSGGEADDAREILEELYAIRGEMYQILARLVYEDTQRALDDQGYGPHDKILLYRGMAMGHQGYLRPDDVLGRPSDDPSASTRRDSRVHWWLPRTVVERPDGVRVWVGNEGADQFEAYWTAIDPVLQPINSWSISRSTARQFGPGDGGIVMTAYVPREAIVSFPRTGIGCLGEEEFVVMNIPGEVIVEPTEGGPSLPRDWLVGPEETFDIDLDEEESA